MTDLNIGRLVSKRYQLHELLGAGAMGRVYLAKDTLLGGVPVAVKFLTLSIDNKKIRVLERFEQEAKTCALLGQKSIHIVRVMDYGVDENGSPFYVMEYLQGKSLSSVIRSQSLSVVRFLSLARQICLGLQCAHQGILFDGQTCSIIHRDIKPSNMLVIEDSSLGELVKVLDFGIAKLLQADSSQTNYYMGTWAYSSPEQMDGKELDNRSDIYSLGIMLFEMIAKKLPVLPESNSFGGWYKAHRFLPPSSFASVNPHLEVPQEVEKLILSCLAKEPGNRPQSIGELLPVLINLEQRYGAATPATQKGNKEVSSKGTVRDQIHLPPTVPSLQDYTGNTQLATTLVGNNETLIAGDKDYELISWPKNKPIADIIFPHFTHNNQEITAAVWVMLPQQEIEKHLQGTRYNQFLFVPSPHPVVLWITVLYTYRYGPKWLSCYLDLKTPAGEKITHLLGETGNYKLLLFAREAPQNACGSLPISIADAQRRRLQQWFVTGRKSAMSADPQLSKELLKKEFEKIKPQIVAKLEQLSLNPYQ